MESSQHDIPLGAEQTVSDKHQNYILAWNHLNDWSCDRKGSIKNKENNVFKDAIGVKGIGFKQHGNHPGNHGSHYGKHRVNGLTGNGLSKLLENLCVKIS